MFEKLTTPEEVFSYKLGCALSMEKDILGVLEKLEKETQRKELCQLFHTHAEQTHQHIRNIEESFRLLGEEPDDNPGSVIPALEQDGHAAIKKTDEGTIDAVILAGATEVEHYEIAVYETLLTNAEARSAPEVVALLRQNLEQEQAALENVNSAARRISHEGYKLAVA